MKNFFEFNERLGIHIPILSMEWEQYDTDTQQAILLEWEKIRGYIPDRIKELEDEINDRQAMLANEENFLTSCCLNEEIASLASTINDLWIWYREHQEVSKPVVHH